MIQKVKYNILDLENVSDEELISLIYDKSSELEFGTFGESLDKADKAMSEFQSMWIMESEVHNGGFDQFFLNNGLEYGKTALNGLKRIGAEKYSVLLEKAIQIFKNQSSEFQNKRNPDFNELDDEFYDLKGLEQIQINYIRMNNEKFVVE